MGRVLDFELYVVIHEDSRGPSCNYFLWAAPTMKVSAPCFSAGPAGLECEVVLSPDCALLACK